MGYRGVAAGAGRGLNRHNVIQLVATSVPCPVRQRKRKGRRGTGSMEKQPISSTGAAVVTPSRVCASIVPSPGGMTWPSSESSVTSSSIDVCPDLKVRARMEAVSDRTLALRSSVRLES